MDNIATMLNNVQFPLLQHLTTAELQKLLDEDEQVDSMTADHELISSRKQAKEMIIVESQSITDFNLSRESRLIEGRQRLVRLHDDNKNSRAVYDTSKKRLDEFDGQFSIAAAKLMLETSATKIEEDSEEIANKFLDGDMSIDDFLQTFHGERVQAHLQRIRSDKMKELLGKYDVSIKTSPNMLTASHATPTVPSKPVPALRNNTGVNSEYQNLQPDYKPIPVPRGAPVYTPGH